MHPLLFQDTKHENHIAILWARLLAKLTYYCAHIVDKKIYNIVEKLKQIKKEQQRILRSFQTKRFREALGLPKNCTPHLSSVCSII